MGWSLGRGSAAAASSLKRLRRIRKEFGRFGRLRLPWRSGCVGHSPHEVYHSHCSTATYGGLIERFRRLRRPWRSDCSRHSPHEAYHSRRSTATDGGLTLPSCDAQSMPFTSFLAADDDREFHCFYRNVQAAPIAHATKIDAKKLDERSLREVLVNFGVRIFYIERQDGQYDTLPSAKSRFNNGDWVYFHIPRDSEEVKTKLTIALRGHSETTGDEGMDAAGSLTEFTLEFDCIVFPQHIGAKATLGDVPVVQGRPLDLRHRFGLNILGIDRRNTDTIDWFPGPDAQVRPGDLGLLIRALRRIDGIIDGSTTSTVTNRDLKKFMEPKMFAKAAEADTSSKFHCFYRNTEQAPVAHLTKIDGEKLDQAVLNRALERWDIRVLLLHRQDGTYETPGCYGVTLNHGDWVYFSDPVRGNESDATEALTALKQALCGVGHTAITETDDRFTAGSLTDLTLEVDCFEFPKHSNVPVVDMQGAFGLNILGIQRRNAKEVEWFPQQDAQGRAGDLGLLIRAPRNDASTKSTVSREVLEEFMDPKKFRNKMPKQRKLLSRWLRQRWQNSCTGMPS